MPAIRSRMSSSSSTMRISDAICDPCLLIRCPFRALLCQREGQNDLRAVMIGGIGMPGVLQHQFAAMVFENLAHDREAKPRALGARGDVRLGQPVAMLLRQA